MLKKNPITLTAYAFLLFPILIFLLNWTKWFISIPLILAIIYGFYQVISDNEPKDFIRFSLTKKNVIILVIIFGWVALSGVGGLAWQNRWDHMFRNAIFNDLVNYAWPVMDFSLETTRTLVYYFGFWLPSAGLAKLFGNISVGYISLYFWTVFGVILAILLVFNWLKKISVKVVLVFIFFSGLDIISYVGVSYLQQGLSISQILLNLRSWQHLELILEIVNASSNTTLLFWLYNQIIPFWIGFMLILSQRNNKHLIFTFSLLILYSPFPAFSLIPFIIYRMFKNVNFKFKYFSESFVRLFKSAFTISNISGFIFMILVSLFFMSGNAVNTIWFFPLDFGVIRGILIFLTLEFFVFFPFMWPQIRKNFGYWTIFVTTVLFSFVVLGKCCDFAWRTSIPLTYFTMLLILRELVELKNMRTVKVIYLIIILAVGAFTPVMEMMRTVSKTKHIIQGDIQEPLISDGLSSVFDSNNSLKDLFVGSKDSFFIDYLIKK